jgi:uncharacterized membrane protein
METNRKITTRFREILRQELQIWQTDGLVSSEQSAVISQKYRLDQIQKESTHLLILAIYIIGAALIGGGVISFVAAHWEIIPAGAKVAMIIACMLAAHIIGYYLWKISGLSPRLGHALVVLGTIVFGANIGLMAQIFHIRSDFYNGFFAWAIGAILMAYALQSIPNAVVAIIVWFIGFCGGVESHERVFAAYPFIAAAVFLPVAFFNRSALVFSLSLLATGFAVVIHTFTLSDNWTHLISSGLVAPGIALLLVGVGLLLRRTVNFSVFGSNAMIIAAVFAAFGAYVSSFHSYDMRFPELLKERLWLSSAIPLYVLCVAAWLAALKHVLSDVQARWFSGGIFVSCVFVAAPIVITPLVMSSPDSFWCVVSANAACVILAVTFIANGFLLLDRRIFWAGILFTALVIASRFLEYETGLIIKAVIFIACGIAIILAGVGFENYLRKRRIANE